MAYNERSRYARQEIFAGIGKEGQERIRKGRVAILGLSGLGTVTAEYLARAGVGFLRLVDGECVEEIELQRETLLTEEDAGKEIPRTVAVKDRLNRINSQVEAEDILSDINAGNIGRFIEDVDLVIDAADSLEARLLTNEACLELKKPWIYGGALAASGMTVTFLPEEDAPCLKCLLGDQTDSGEKMPTCATEGVLMPAIGTIASIQAAEALKILTGSPDVRREMLTFDLWENSFDILPFDKDPECPVCAHHAYQFYGKAHTAQIQAMCGKDSVQIIPGTDRQIQFASYAQKLEKQGTVRYNQYTLDYRDSLVEFKLFGNGRAVIKHVSDEAKARAVYADYIGL